MSHDTELEHGPESEAVVEYLERWYHVPVLLGVLLYMLWTRLDSFGEFVQDGIVYFRGNDAYYHYRATMYSVENWPRRLYADPWTYFPYGTTVGNFGSLMDQTVATVALIVGLGDPSSRQVAMIAVAAPAVIGTLCAALAYVLAKHLADSRIGGLTAAAVLALVPQSAWVSRSTVGFYDHHIAEAFMMIASVTAMAYALAVVRRERPVFEQVQDRDWEGLKPSVAYSALAGVVLGLYLHVWAPGQVLIGIFGVFFVIAMIHAVLRSESPEHLAFAGVVAGVAGAVVVLPWTLTLDVSNTELSLPHLIMFLALGAGCAFLGWLARYWDREDLEPTGYPAAVAGAGVVGAGLLWLVVPEAFDAILGGVNRIVPFGRSETTLTVAEAQPMDTSSLGALSQQFYDGYGLTYITALIAALYMTGRALLARRPRSEHLLVGVWTAFLLSMAIAQVRFHYYLVLAVAVLNGWLVARVVRAADFPSIDAAERIEPYHVLTIFVVLLVLFVPITAGAFVDSAGTPTAAQLSGDQQPGTVQYWDENLEWMADSTPQPGTFGDGDDPMAYYGPFDATEDYEYPEGAYGVMSWWDYGHWITATGERIPAANPFQEGPRASSAFFQESDEDRANKYLDALATEEGIGNRLYEMNESELDGVLANRTDQQRGEQVRYVTIDDQMAGGKFSAITRWTGPDHADYVERRDLNVSGQEARLPVRNQQFHDTMLGTMYFHDGAGLEHYRLVKEAPRNGAVVSVAIEQNGDLQPLFVGWDLNTIAQEYPSIYRAVERQVNNPQAGSLSPITVYDVRVESSVKTFERVEGATLTGQAAANDTVLATLELETATGLTKTYRQTATADEDGQFEMTVPYATNDELGVEDGYTEPDVVANGTYTVRSGDATTVSGAAEGVEVPEPAIYEGREIEVDLEEPEGGEDELPDDSDAATGNETQASDDAAAGSSESGGQASGSSSDQPARASSASTATASGASALGAGPAADAGAAASDVWTVVDDATRSTITDAATSSTAAARASSVPLTGLRTLAAAVGA